MATTDFLVPFSDEKDELRSPRKRKAILRAAAGVFLEKGYLGTSVDQVASAAGVSKQTVYKHFTDKESLFSELVTTLVVAVADNVDTEIRRLEFNGDIEKDLIKLAVCELSLVLTPPIMQLRRLAVGEVPRFPELARAFYDNGPARTILSLSSVFERLSKLNKIIVDEPLVAAAHFNWLVMSEPLNRVLFLGDDAIPSAENVRKIAKEGVRVFLAAYGRQRV